MNLTVLAILALLLGGCAVTPDTITHQRPGSNTQYAQPAVGANGAIFHQNAYRPIFEDHKARLVGDNITIVITESNRATKAGSDSSERTNSANFNKPRFFGSSFEKVEASGSGMREYEEESAKSANNVFNGTIAVSVIDVAPNGNLIVSGEKQIAMDNGSEFIRFSGVIDPKDIAIGNQVASTKVADARIEYRTNTRIDAAEVASKLSRFFLSVLPF
ncbi:flagellar basal body L-ring protein FlgH [Oxalobacter vibrioformis]|uniref:Flagellar L-ring protein n=1 Tax=Oxalobacter vibrioformis TaxID=933080 RepID=A0A9E9LTU8_9BURK|nr:flagellar basal body L-ring protein FlgH [Oxalobacter vibrioformis]WAW09530.1 flagellar basal body L-ring protein FlgH [Oxalobacter vibrioformis]